MALRHYRQLLASPDPGLHILQPIRTLRRFLVLIRGQYFQPKVLRFCVLPGKVAAWSYFNMISAGM